MADAPVLLTVRNLTAAAFRGLADVPPEMEWFANLGNKATRRAYQTALQGLSGTFQLKVLTAIAVALRNKILEASHMPSVYLNCRSGRFKGFNGLRPAFGHYEHFSHASC